MSRKKSPLEELQERLRAVVGTFCLVAFGLGAGLQMLPTLLPVIGFVAAFIGLVALCKYAAGRSGRL